MSGASGPGREVLATLTSLAPDTALSAVPLDVRLTQVWRREGLVWGVRRVGVGCWEGWCWVLGGLVGGLGVGC